MTCREKLAMEHPEKINPETYGGCESCPSYYGYLEDPPADVCGGEENCINCWNREIPGTLPMQYPIDTEAEGKLANDTDAPWLKKNLHIPKAKADEGLTDGFNNPVPEIVQAAEQLAKEAKAKADEFLGIRDPSENANKCVGCGAAIPEGTQVCPTCDDIANHKVMPFIPEKQEYRMPYPNLKIDIGCTIKDSGDRTQFETGAVRDMREGKGRCDLMPLNVVGDIMIDQQAKATLHNIYSFQVFGDTDYLKLCIEDFARHNGGCNTLTGDLCTIFLEVAKHFEEGAKKYGENNWQKGIPVYCYIDSAVRHYLKWLRGDKDEPHDRAFVWNIMCCIWEVDYHKEESE